MLWWQPHLCLCLYLYVGGVGNNGWGPLPFSQMAHSVLMLCFPLWSRWCVQTGLLPTYQQVSLTPPLRPQRLLSMEHSGSVTVGFCGWGGSREWR